MKLDLREEKSYETVSLYSALLWCPKKVILFWSLPSRNTQEYYEADDEEDSPHQGQRGDLVQAGEVLKILKYVNAMEA